MLQETSQQTQQELGKLREKVQQGALVLQKQESDCAVLEESYKMLQASHESVVNELKIMTHSYHALQIEEASYKGRLEIIQAVLKKTEDEIVSLKDSNFFLSHEKELLQAQLRK